MRDEFKNSFFYGQHYLFFFIKNSAIFPYFWQFLTVKMTEIMVIICKEGLEKR